MKLPPKRLAVGGRIDRSRPVEFAFDGKKLHGFRGDTLASALLANDFALVGRSFKYHRPRGIYSAGSEEPNALVTLGAGARTEPNAASTGAGRTSAATGTVLGLTMVIPSDRSR